MAALNQGLTVAVWFILRHSQHSQGKDKLESCHRDSNKFGSRLTQILASIGKIPDPQEEYRACILLSRNLQLLAVLPILPIHYLHTLIAST